MSENHQDLIEIQKQFLVSNPLQNFDWKGVLSSLHTSVELQQHLLSMTVSLPNVKKYPLKASYQKQFVKKIINKLEMEGCDVVDELYNIYCELLSSNQESESSPHKESFFRHFVLPPGAAVPSLVLQESALMVSSGTTGLSCWQAGVVLAEWCLTHASMLAGRCVLELGSGCGLTGLVAAVASGASQVVLTDGHEAVLRQLCRNVDVNLGTSELLLQQDRERARTKVGGTCVSVLHLPWEEVPSSPDLPVPDLILAADVLFDPSCFSDLKDALLHLLSLKPGGSTAVIACTIRNQETLNNFLQLMSSNNLTVSPEDGEVKQVFYYDRSAPIQIYRLSQSASA